MTDDLHRRATDDLKDLLSEADRRLREHISLETQRIQQSVDDVTALIHAENAGNEKLNNAHVARLDEKIGALNEQLDRRLHAARDRLDAIFEEHRVQGMVAEQEREKAAKALRDELNRAIRDGDQALSRHIDQQVLQIEAALGSAEKLELQRFEEVKAMVESVHREVGLTFEASERAIQKAEAAYEKRFAAQNAFREQLADQTNTFIPREVFDAQVRELRSKIEDAAASGANFLPREVFDRTVVEWSAWRDGVTKTLAESSGTQSAVRRQGDKSQAWQIWAAGGVLTVVLALVIFVANILTGA